MQLQYLKCYNTSNVLAAWKAVGIKSFNLHCVLIQKESSLKMAKFVVIGFMTPATTRMARATSEQALAVIQDSSRSAQTLQTLIGHLVKRLQKAIIHKKLGDHFQHKFQQAATKKSPGNFGERKRLTKARVFPLQRYFSLERLGRLPMPKKGQISS